MLSDAALAHLRNRAEGMLAGCERVFMPLPDGPEGAGGCYVCLAVPRARMSMRDDGAELFWVNVCPDHHGEPVAAEVA